MPKFKAILSDIDGTLTDSEHLHEEAFLVITKQLGANLTPEEAGRYRGISGRDKYASIESRLTDRIGYDAFAERIASYYMKNWQKIDIMPGAKDLIKQAHTQGVRIGAVTNGTRPEADTNIGALGKDTTDLIEFTISVNDVKRGKPAPDGYLQGAFRMGIEPKDILVLEDTPTGVAAAKAAGMTVIQIQPDPALVNDQADIVVPSLNHPAVKRFIGLDQAPEHRRGMSA